ncbi:MAG: bifunctional histidinol-phosphatase/imidazoleglycerol-phosphate dehydratase HisB [Flavobacteriales bacterium]|nr:bifunctional histidinol-phosphatase/imidazoleglycerol-phosphate dehydratase HisB [Flavobacteriales bacterium]MCB9449772.1 bifunctional histidinol-phosphatase/imidazoleglycerol-phosphate dehydratase HisB [Flavobacteriales bacterium]
MKKALFIDRDGTIILEPEDEQIDSLEKLEYYPGAITALAKIAADFNYELVMVTNQDGLGTDSFPEDTFWPAHQKMLRTLAGEGIEFDDVLIDRSLPKDNAPTRKPGTGMMGKYMDGSYDLAACIVIGDRDTDVQLAKNLGCQSILLADRQHPDAGLCTGNWQAVYDFIAAQNGRIGEVTRKTKETDIHIRLNLDGTGRTQITTGLSFFDHMLDQLGKHSLCDLEITTKGDLEVDEHHTIEDTALALGEAFVKALGDKKGVARYGFLLPMDDALAQVAIDFGGRPWIEWEVEFKREKVGDMPTEMFFHFFKSFSDAARCNLNIKAEGQNEHHKIESIFKALARAIGMAVKKQGNALPSTKGVL